MNEPVLEQALPGIASALSHLVVVGGTAHRLFAEHPLATPNRVELLTTEDVDIAAPDRLARDESNTLLEALKAQGFHGDVRGADASRPGYVYRPRPPAHGYLQFIAPLTGDGDGDPNLVFAGIHAERIRDVELLLHEPWTHAWPSGGVVYAVRVVNPVAYVMQKLLTIGSRGAKRPKDLLYVHDTLGIFADNLDVLRANGALIPPLTKKRRARLRAAALEFCFSETDVAREAVRIAPERMRRFEATHIVAACRSGLPKLLGSLVD